YPVKADKREAIPAVTHIDGSGRLQTVHRDTNPLYYRVIEKFGEATGVPVLLNTSFNLRGEPIVASVQNAYRTFVKSGLDTLVAGRFIVKKQQDLEGDARVEPPPPEDVAGVRGRSTFGDEHGAFGVEVEEALHLDVLVGLNPHVGGRDEDFVQDAGAPQGLQYH